MLQENTKPKTTAQILSDVFSTSSTTVPAAVADWFFEKIKQSRSGLFSEVVTVTPAHARQMLAGNDANRTVTNSHVVRMASDITDGKWALNGESIKIAPDGRLTDGQHRLHAVLMANKSIKTVVTFGVPYDARVTTDQGKAKSVGDYLSMQDSVANANNAAAAARILLAYRLGVSFKGGGGKSPITKTRVMAEYYANRKDIDNAVTFANSSASSRTFGGPSFLAAATVILKRISPSAEDFITKFIKGTDLSAGDAILVARDRFIREPRMRNDDRITLLTKAFDAWLSDRKVMRLQVRQRIDAGRKLTKGKPGRKS